MKLRYGLILVVLFSSYLMGASAIKESDTTFKVNVIRDELIFTSAPFRECHASSIVELPGGKLLVVWFGGTYERHPDVCIWGSIQTGRGWSNPVLLADGIINDTLRYPCWNPVLFRSGEKQLILFYKVGPSPEQWWGMFKISTDNGRRWSPPKQMPSGFLGPAKNKPLRLQNARIISPSSTEKGNNWNVHMELSDDNGNSWFRVNLDTTTGYKIIQPAILKLSDGTLIALMRSNQNSVAESRSADRGNSWSKPVLLSLPNPNSGIDAITMENGNHLLVCNPLCSGRDWYTGRSKLSVMISGDAKNWKELVKLTDETSGEYSYPAIIQTSDGLLHITFTNNRTSIRHVILEITK